MAIVEANPNLGAEIVADAKEFVLYSWSVQDQINPIAVAGAEGRHFWDYDGNRYLDFASQLVNVNIGHQHPRIIQAIKDQADLLCTIGPPMANESRSRLGRMLADVTPGDLSVSFFTNGGAEANENAVKLARLVTGRHKIIARYRSYHGATNGAVTLTGDPRRWAVEPGMPGVVRMFDPYTYRCPAGHPDPCPVCTGAPHLEEILEYEGAHTVAAVILETVTGTNGIIPPPDGYLQAIREVCDRHGILLILDEVMAGFGRTGRWFACEHWDVVPDILCVAKGINSGYVPLGAMIARGELVDRVRDRFFPGGLTYAGHPLACASAIASIEAFQDEGVVENAAAMGEWFGEALRGLSERHPSVGDVRGLGCFWGLELVKDRATREMLVPFNASGEAAAPVARRRQGGARAGPLPDDPLERRDGGAAPDDHPCRGGGGRRDPRRRPLPRGRVRRRLAADEGDDGRRRLVERVPEDRVPARHGHDLEQVAERGPVPLGVQVVREVRVGAVDDEGRHARLGEVGTGCRELAVRGDDGRLGVAVAPARVVLDEVAAELVLDERARRVVQLALGEPPLDRVVEACVAPLRPRVLRRPERDVRGNHDRGVEQHEPLDRPRAARGLLEREARAERVPDPGRRLVAQRRLDRVEVVGDAPRRLPRRCAVPEEVGRNDAVGRRERGREALEVPAPRRDAVQADDGRRSLRAPGVDVQRPRHRRVRRAFGPRPPKGALAPLESR